jgi:hypothetical protein
MFATSCEVSARAPLTVSGICGPQRVPERLHSIALAVGSVLPGKMYGRGLGPVLVVYPASAEYVEVGLEDSRGCWNPPWQVVLAHCHAPLAVMLGKICVVQLTEQDAAASLPPPASGLGPLDDEPVPVLEDPPASSLELAELCVGTGRSLPSRPSAGP